MLGIIQRPVLTGLIYAVFALLLPGIAQAELRACNHTNDTISVAIGYSDDGVWTSEGWWTMRAGDCKVMVAGDLTNRYFYWRATQNGQALPSENYFFCTSSKVFTIAGDKNCEARGYDRVGFNQVDIGDSLSYTIDVGTGQGADAGPGDDLNDVRAMLQGTWVAELDRDLVSVISGDEWYLSYKGDKQDTAKFEVAMTCPASEGDGPVVLFTFDFTRGAPDCWGLLHLDPHKMHVYIYSTGEDAVFIK